MWADGETSAAISAVLDTFAEAIAARDLAATLALFAEDEDVTMLGSEADERAVGRPALERMLAGIFAGPSSYRFVFARPSIAAAGDVAWLTTSATVGVEPAGVTLDYRLAAVLARSGGAWRIRLFAGSEPAKPPVPTSPRLSSG